MLNQVNRKFSLHNKRTQRNIFATFFASMIQTATIVLYVLHLMSFIRWCTESHANMQIKGKTWACFLLTSTNAFIFVEGQMIFGGIFLKIDTFCVVVYFNNNDEFKFNCLLQILKINRTSFYCRLKEAFIDIKITSHFSFDWFGRMFNCAPLAAYCDNIGVWFDF